MKRALVLVATAALVAGCASTTEGESTATTPAASASAPSFAGDPSDFTVTSDDIAADGELSNSAIGQSSPSCNGEGRSLHVAWSEPPAGTVSVVLTFANVTHDSSVYWARADIDPAQGEIPHGRYGASTGTELVNAFSFRYPVPPCPDDTELDEYLLTVWALDTEIGDDARTYLDIEEAIAGHVLATATLEAHARGIE